MKVFFILDNAFPSNNPSAKRVKCYCKGLNYHGISTEILTFSHKGNPDDSEGLFFKMIGVGHNGKLLSKIKTLYHNIRDLKQYINDNAQSDDIIFLYSDGLITGLLPLVLGKKRKYVRELCEIPYYYNNTKSRISRWFYFTIVFKLYSGVVAISESLVRCAERYKSPSCKIVKIPILVDIDKYKDTEIKHFSGEKIIFHSGSHTEEKDGFNGMIEILGILKSQYNIEVNLYCTGNKPTTNEYKYLIEKYNISANVHYLGYISDTTLLEWQRKSNFFLINKYDSFQNRYCFATKLGEYLASGKLVITTSVGEVVNYLLDNKDCIFVHPGAPTLMAQKISEVYCNPNQYEKIAANGKKIATEQFDCYKRGHDLISFLNTIKMQ